MNAKVRGTAQEYDKYDSLRERRDADSAGNFRFSSSLSLFLSLSLRDLREWNERAKLKASVPQSASRLKWKYGGRRTTVRIREERDGGGDGGGDGHKGGGGRYW